MRATGRSVGDSVAGTIRPESERTNEISKEENHPGSHPVRGRRADNCLQNGVLRAAVAVPQHDTF